MSKVTSLTARASEGTARQEGSESSPNNGREVSSQAKAATEAYPETVPPTGGSGVATDDQPQDVSEVTSLTARASEGTARQEGSESSPNNGREVSSQAKAATEAYPETASTPPNIASQEAGEMLRGKRKRPAPGHFKNMNIWTILLFLHTITLFFTSATALRIPVHGMCGVSVNTANIEMSTDTLNATMAR